MVIIDWIFDAIAGSLTNAIPIFVRGPTGQIVIDRSSASSSVSTSQSTACCGCNSILGSCQSGPSNPVSPCTSSAVTNFRTIGLSQPEKTFMSFLPASSHIRRAFTSVRCSGALPATHVIPITSSSGDARARSIAIASSWPGSVSIIIFFCSTSAT